MPVSKSLKDRLRVFESPQKESVTAEVPKPKLTTPKKAGSVAKQYLRNAQGAELPQYSPRKSIRTESPTPKPTTVVDQYTRDVRTPSPSWSKPNLRQTPRREIVESREEVEGHRPDESVERGGIDRESAEVNEIPVHSVKEASSAKISPKKQLSAYEALIQEKKDRTAVKHDRHAVPVPSPVSSQRKNTSPFRQVVTSPISRSPRSASPIVKPTSSSRIQNPFASIGTLSGQRTGSRSPLPKTEGQSPILDKPAASSNFQKPSPQAQISMEKTYSPMTFKLSHTARNTKSRSIPVLRKTPSPRRSAAPDSTKSTRSSTSERDNIGGLGIIVGESRSESKTKSKLPSPRFSLSPVNRLKGASPSNKTNQETNVASLSMEGQGIRHKKEKSKLLSPRFSLSPITKQALSLLEQDEGDIEQLHASLSSKDDQTSSQKSQEDTSHDDPKILENPNIPKKKSEIRTASQMMFPLFPSTTKRPRGGGSDPVEAREQDLEESKMTRPLEVSTIPRNPSQTTPQDEISSPSRKSYSRLVELRERSPALLKAFKSKKAKSEEKVKRVEQAAHSDVDPLRQMDAYNKGRADIESIREEGASGPSATQSLKASVSLVNLHKFLDTPAPEPLAPGESASPEQNQDCSNESSRNTEKQNNKGGRRSRTERYANILKQKGRKIVEKRKSPRSSNKKRQRDAEGKTSGGKKTEAKKFFGSQRQSTTRMPYSPVLSSSKELEEKPRKDPSQVPTKRTLYVPTGDHGKEKQTTEGQKSPYASPLHQQFSRLSPSPSGPRAVSVNNDLFDKTSNRRTAPQELVVATEADGLPSMGSLTVEGEEINVFSPLMANSPGQNVDVGESRPISPLSPVTPSKFENARSVFENASRNTPTHASPASARNIFGGITSRNKLGNWMKADEWTSSDWPQVSEEEKVMSSMERLYNMKKAPENQIEVQEAMNPFSLSSDYASGSFPSTFDETLMDTKSIHEDMSKTPSDFPSKDPSLVSGDTSQEVLATGSLGPTNSLLHGELVAEDGSGLQYSSGSNNLKTSRSSATGNFISSSSSQMSKSTAISREEFLKARTRSTVTSSESERLPAIPDVVKEEEIAGDARNRKNSKSEREDGSKDAGSTGDGTIDPTSRSDALRWWQRKYAQNVAGETNIVVKKAFQQSSVRKSTQNARDEEDVFSGLEETQVGDNLVDRVANETDSSGRGQPQSLKNSSTEKKHSDIEGPSTFSAISLDDFNSFVPPPPPPPPPPPLTRTTPPSKQTLISEKGQQVRPLDYKIVGSIAEVSESEVSEPTDATQENHAGMVVNGYKMDKVTSDITQPTLSEGRERRKYFTKNDRFGPIEESNQPPQIDPNIKPSFESNGGSTSQSDSQNDTNSRLTSQVESNSRFDSQTDYPMDSQVDTNSRLDSHMISESESHDKGGRDVRSESEDSEQDDTREYHEVDSGDMSYSDSREPKRQSAFEFTAAAVLGLGYSLVHTLSSTLRLSELPNCAEDAGSACVKRVDDCGYMMGLDEATDMSSRNVTTRGSLSPIMELNEEERKLWDIWEERDELSGRKKKVKPGDKDSMEKSDQREDSAFSSSMDSSMNRMRIAQRREQAQSKLLEHAQKARKLYRDTADDSILSTKTEDSDALSGEDKSTTTRSVYVQQHILEKFSSKLRNDKVEVLKLNRHGKWQIRFITVSKEVSWLKNKKDTTTPKSSQFPQALLWYKAHNTKNNGLADLKNDGRGGFLFSQLKKVERDPNASPPAPIPKKLKGKYGRYAGAKIQYTCEDSDREMIFGFQDPMDAEAFCTAINILRQVVHRNEDDA